MKINLEKNGNFFSYLVTNTSIKDIQEVILSQLNQKPIVLNSAVGDPYSIQLENNNCLKLQIENNIYKIDYFIDQDNQKIYLKIGSQSISFNIINENTLFSSTLSGGSIKSDLPGKVISVHKEENQKVKKDDLLVVIEAMKMEHRLTSPSNGKITKIHIKAGDQTKADQVLIEIDEENDE